MVHNTMQITNTTVGIVTRTKNRPVLLKRALESVLGQSFQNWTMVIVNDGGNAEAVDKLVNYYSVQAQGRIKVIHNEVSLGMEAASNIGIRSVETDYFVIHDDDDSWASEFLTFAVAELEQAHAKNPRIKGVITRVNKVFERIEGNIVVVERVEPLRPWLKEGLLPLDSMLSENQFSPIQFLYKYDVFKELGLYREDLPVLGDWEFNIRFMLRYDIQLVPQFLAFYHHRETDLHSAYGNSITSSIDKHMFFRQLLCNEWLRNDIASGSSDTTSISKLNHLSHMMHRQAAAIECVEQRLYQVITKFDGLDGLSKRPGLGKHLRNLGLLVKLWWKSGRTSHYFKRFIESLAKNGIGETVRTVKLWYSIKKS